MEGGPIIRFAVLRRVCLLGIVFILASGQSVASAPTPSPGYPGLVALSAEWRLFARPVINACVPDYSAAAMAHKAAALRSFQHRFSAMDTAGWSRSELGDYRLLAAEMNGLDFDLRVLKPWARDPSFYATVFAEQSDVPEPEGPSASPPIDLYRFTYPLRQADQKSLGCILGAVPRLLEQGRTNMMDAEPISLWVYGNLHLA